MNREVKIKCDECGHLWNLYDEDGDFTFGTVWIATCPGCRKLTHNNYVEPRNDITTYKGVSVCGMGRGMLLEAVDELIGEVADSRKRIHELEKRANPLYVVDANGVGELYTRFEKIKNWLRPCNRRVRRQKRRMRKEPNKSLLSKDPIMNYLARIAFEGVEQQGRRYFISWPGLRLEVCERNIVPIIDFDEIKPAD